MKKLFVVFVLISSMLCAQAPVSNSPFNHGHRRLWVEVALVAAAVGVTILVEHKMHNHPKPLPPTPAQLFGNPKSPYYIPSYGEPCWMVLIEGKVCGPAWVNP